jgi:hypothetical protein
MYSWFLLPLAIIKVLNLRSHSPPYGALHLLLNDFPSEDHTGAAFCNRLRSLANDSVLGLLTLGCAHSFKLNERTARSRPGCYIDLTLSYNDLDDGDERLQVDVRRGTPIVRYRASDLGDCSSSHYDSRVGAVRGHFSFR